MEMTTLTVGILLGIGITIGWIAGYAVRGAKARFVEKYWGAAIQEQQDTADSRQCPCRLHFKHTIPEALHHGT